MEGELRDLTCKSFVALCTAELLVGRFAADEVSGSLDNVEDRERRGLQQYFGGTFGSRVLG